MKVKCRRCYYKLATCEWRTIVQVHLNHYIPFVDKAKFEAPQETWQVCRGCMDELVNGTGKME